MSPIGCSLLALACAALFACARAEDLPDDNPACRKLIIGDIDPKYTNSKKLPVQHINRPGQKVTVPNVIPDHFLNTLVGIKYVACDFLSGNPPSIKKALGSARQVDIRCDVKPPGCLAGLEMQATQYGIHALNTGLQ